MLEKVKNILADIFLEDPFSRKNEKDIFCPQDLTSHYQQELKDMVIDKILVAARYADLDHSLEAYKYRSDRHYSTLFVDLLSKLLEQYSEILVGDDIAFVWVPMHWSRYILRWFNHIDSIVDALAKKEGLTSIKPLKPHLSRRQSQLSKKARKKNREHAYSLKSSIQLPKNIILIDDVISTGSTANACARLLKDAGVERVYGVFLASNQ